MSFARPAPSAGATSARRRARRAALAFGATALAACTLAGTATAASAAASTPAFAPLGLSVPSSLPGAITSLLRACDLPLAGHVACGAVVAQHANPAAAAAAPTGLGPADLASAYKLPASGAGQTVAIVDAMDDPNAEADLATYRSTYGLPACTTASGCFKKVNESGVQGSYPTGDSGWGEEISLDLDAVSATCPKCNIVLVEATSTSDADLAAAVKTAASFHPASISNSYGGSEASGEDTAAYDQPGIAVTVSSGDSGYGVEFPASSPYVTAVGGTALTKASNARGWTETVWNTSSGFLGIGAEGGGSGCSKYETKPAWQKDTGCTKRTVADVSAVADPATGLAVYDTYGESGWLTVGGTSLSSPVIASVYALAGNTASIGSGASYSYAHTSSLNDVTSGNNGTCGGLFSGGSASKYLCTAGAGYDGPTGNGTPNGVGAF